MSSEELKAQRSNTKKSITRIRNIVEASANGERVLSSHELKCRLGILESYFKQVLTIQGNIERLDAEDQCRGDLEDLYISAKVSIHSQLGEAANDTLLETNATFLTSSVKLPQLKLPTFDGKYFEFTNFMTTFTQIIDREFGLSNIEKFNHLLDCLKGSALETVKAFPVSNANYPKAFERLKQRYDNSTLIFLDNIAALFNLPSINKPNSNELRSLVDNASALYGSLLSLGSEKQISEALLIHLVMEKVDDFTKRKWKESLDFSNLPTWAGCTKVLERQCQYLETTISTRPYEFRTQASKKL